MGFVIARFLFWTPRILGLLFALFLGAFALDAFQGGGGAFRAIGTFLIHLIPTYTVIAALMISWRREWIGAVLFTGFALFYLFRTWGRFPWPVHVAISGPLFLMGILFALSRLFSGRMGARE